MGRPTFALVRLARLTLCLVMVAASCRWAPRVVTGVDAEAKFVYKEQPVHPLCVRFSLEQASVTPNELSRCTGLTPVTRDERGWLTAAFPDTEGRGLISYHVLAARGNRFLIASDMWGGGSGQFSFLSWVRVADGTVIEDTVVRGGDRCAGGLSHFVVDSGMVSYQVSTPAAHILELAGVSSADSLRSDLRDSYPDCDGDATYIYNPATARSRFVSLVLSDEAPPPSAIDLRPPQICFDSIVRRYRARRQQTLIPEQLQEFGRAFSAHCAGR